MLEQTAPAVDSRPTSPDRQSPVVPRVYHYYDLIMAAFVTVLICSEFFAASKVAKLGPFVFGAGVVFFPLSYIFGDILTEVYGYARSRKVIWTGFAALGFATLMCWIVVRLPPDSRWAHQQALETILGNTWRIVLASMTAYFAGEWSNSVTLAKMKIWTGGRYLWTRTIGSTIIGEAVDSLIFYPLAFLFVWPVELVVRVMIANYLIKVATEVVFTPVTYRVVSLLKRAEGEDYYDIGTNFTPLPSL